MDIKGLAYCVESVVFDEPKIAIFSTSVGGDRGSL